MKTDFGWAQNKTEEQEMKSYSKVASGTSLLENNFTLKYLILISEVNASYHRILLADDYKEQSRSQASISLCSNSKFYLL